MYKLKITESANSELNEILNYISDELKNPIAASNFLDEIQKCYINLKENPEIYVKCNSDELYNLNYRKIFIKNYILIFRIDENINTVFILHFFYAKRDYLKLI